MFPMAVIKPSLKADNKLLLFFHDCHNAYLARRMLVKIENDKKACGLSDSIAIIDRPEVIPFNALLNIFPGPENAFPARYAAFRSFGKIE